MDIKHYVTEDNYSKWENDSSIANEPLNANKLGGSSSIDLMENLDYPDYYKDIYNVVKEVCPQSLPHRIPFAVQIDFIPKGSHLYDWGCQLPSDVRNQFSLPANLQICFRMANLNMDEAEELTFDSEELFTLLSDIPLTKFPELNDKITNAIEECRQVVDHPYRKSAFKKLGSPLDQHIYDFYYAEQPVSDAYKYNELRINGISELDLEKYCVLNIHGEIWESIFGSIVALPPTSIGGCSHGEYQIVVELVWQMINKYKMPTTGIEIWISNLAKPATFEHENYVLYLFGLITKPEQNYDVEQLWKFNSKNSFIHKAIDIVLQKWVDIHAYGLSHTDSSYIMDHGAIMQLAARDITEGNMLPSYEIFNLLSAAKSEGTSCYGKILFISDKNLPYMALSQRVTLNKENIRYVRKLLEMTADTTKNFALVADNISILGLTQLPTSASHYAIEFRGLMKWTLRYNGNELLSFDENRYYYEIPEYSKSLLQLKDFLSLDADGENSLTAIVEAAFSQAHGTMLVIYKDTEIASAEAERFVLKNRGFQFKDPQTLSSDLLLSISALDGAIILDCNWTCHGFGIIVDGEARTIGSPARGARFNSAKNYVACCKRKCAEGLAYDCAAIVVSEDRTIDVFTTDDAF